MAQPFIEKTIAELILENPRYQPVFNGMQLNFEIERDLTLGEVCFVHGLNYRDVVHQLETSTREARLKGESDLAAYDIPQLIGYILFTHHDFADKEFPRLERLIAEAVGEGGGQPELLELQGEFHRLQDFFRRHMREEERYFFPFFMMISTDKDAPPLGGENMERLVKIMESEHTHVDQALDRIRQKTRDFHFPAQAEPRTQQLMEGLKFLEAELRRHARVEDHILFPKVMALEEERRGRGNPKASG